MVDQIDPPGDVPRTKFIEPYQWDNPAGRVLSSMPWEVAISFAIIVNICTMSMDYYGADDAYKLQLKHFEVIFCGIFLGEMGLKFAGMGGWKFYFAEPFNQFDFLLVTTSIPSAVSTIAGTAPFINLSMLRVLKMLRMLKLLKKTRQLLMVVAQAAKPIGNLGLFILFTLSIAAIFGMALFGGLMCDVYFDPVTEECPSDEVPRVRFDTFPMSVYALFQVMTGEDWNAIMFTAMKQSPIFASIFFVIFFILLNYILMEMFCAVILENFQLRAEERHDLQRELFTARKAKSEAAKALAEGVDKQLAKMREEAEKKAADEEQKKRAAQIRKQNEAKKNGTPLEEEEEPVKKTPEELAKEANLKAQKDQELADQIQAELKAQQPDIPVPEAGEDYMDGGGATNNMITDALDDTPVTKKKKNQRVVVVVEKSCFVFSQDNPFREFCFKIVSNPLFDTLMFTTICVSSIVLALDTPYKIDPFIAEVISLADPTILGIFSVEFCIRVVASGFSGKPSAYIMDSWNQLDFFVLMFSWFCVLLPDLIPGAFARTIRIGRAIRPLRMINQNERIQIVFNAVFMSLPDILNVVFLLVFVMFMFSVMGMGFFMGRFYSCNDEGNDFEPVTGMANCVGIFESEEDGEGPGGFFQPRVWSNPNNSFDNVFEGILTLYEVSSLEGWPDILYSTTDMTGVETQPSQDNEAFMWWYICIYICVGPFFVLNLVVGVIIEKFNQISGRGLLTDEQRMYKDTLLQAMLHDDSAPLERPAGFVRGTCYAICQNANFESFILVMVIINSVLMGTEHYKMSESLTSLLNNINFLFVAVFTIECGIKLTGLGPKPYFNDPWNVMDFCIVVGCLLMVPLDGIINIQILRPFRLFMIFRMIRRAKGIRLMVCTLLMSLPALFNVTCLLALAFFIFAVLGMSTYGNVRFGDNLNYAANFRHFDSSLLLLTRMVTGEGWNAIMHDCMVTPPACTDFFGVATAGVGSATIFESWYSHENLLAVWDTNKTITGHYWLPNDCGTRVFSFMYFIMFQIIGNYMVVNLFVAVILDNYAFMANVGDAEISEFVLTKFRKIWYGITLKDKHVDIHLGKYMRAAKLREFLSKLGAPLGVVLWDVKGMAKYKQIQQEVRRGRSRGQGISYRKMQYIVCQYAMSVDPACDMPLEDKEARTAELLLIRKERCANMLQAAYRGKLGRKALGVEVGPQKSESEMQAGAFKKKFADMMSNPKQVLTAPAILPAAAAAPSGEASAGAMVPTAGPAQSGPGVQPNGGAAVTESQANDTAQVRNVFRERAAARAAASKSKGN